MTVYENENIYRLFFNQYENYDDMESFFDKFKTELNAVVIDKIDGPYSRIWKILIDNIGFKLIVDDSYGSSIVAENEVSKEKLKFLYSIIDRFIY